MAFRRRRTQSLDDNPANFPPGTVKLLSRRGKGNDEEITRIPKPTNDPNDPLAWPMWRKCFNFALLSAMTAAIFTGMGIQSIFWGRMRKEMNITTAQLLTAKALQLSGEALTCMLFIPFARKYGRRLLYILSTAVFTAAVWWSAYMKTAPELYLSNLLKGLAGAINETAVQMSIRDMFFIHQRGTANGIYFFALKFGFSLSPMAAGAQATAFGWRSCYQTLGAFMTVLTLLFALAYEETKYVRPMEYNGKDSVESLELGSVDSYMDEKPLPAPVRAPFPHFLRLQLLTPTSESLWKTFYQPWFSMAIPQVLFTALLFGFDLATTTIMGSMKSLIFVEPPYNFNPKQLGLMHLGPFIGSVLGSLYGGYLVDKVIVWLTRRNNDIFEPEMRLHFLPLPALIMAAGVAMFGITAELGMHWFYPVLGTSMNSFGFGAIADIVFTLIIDSYPDIVSQSFVVIAFFRNAISVIGAFALTPWREAMSVSNMFILIASLSLAINFVSIPMAIWGKRIRASSAPRYYNLAKSGY
ncbi:hypothetical protein RJ55_01745 [Drechmeria coniospora]|nr:hypothetical protein RJ55_01745 [Drechmeria coniospora]